MVVENVCATLRSPDGARQKITTMPLHCREKKPTQSRFLSAAWAALLSRSSGHKAWRGRTIRWRNAPQPGASARPLKQVSARQRRYGPKEWQPPTYICATSRRICSSNKVRCRWPVAQPCTTCRAGKTQSFVSCNHWKRKRAFGVVGSASVTETFQKSLCRAYTVTEEAKLE